jgi:hypothetical protein
MEIREFLGAGSEGLGGAIETAADGDAGGLCEGVKFAGGEGF